MMENSLSRTGKCFGEKTMCFVPLHMLLSTSNPFSARTYGEWRCLAHAESQVARDFLIRLFERVSRCHDDLAALDFPIEKKAETQVVESEAGPHQHRRSAAVKNGVWFKAIYSASVLVVEPCFASSSCCVRAENLFSCTRHRIAKR